MDPCTICHEPIYTGKIGITVPCGHAYHLDCFSSWNATGRTQRRDLSSLPYSSNEINCKCPNCNEYCTNFAPIFLKFPKFMEDCDDDKDDDENDDIEDDCKREEKQKEMEEKNTVNEKFCTCVNPNKKSSGLDQKVIIKPINNCLN